MVHIVIKEETRNFNSLFYFCDSGMVLGLVLFFLVRAIQLPKQPIVTPLIAAIIVLLGSSFLSYSFLKWRIFWFKLLPSLGNLILIFIYTLWDSGYSFLVGVPLTIGFLISYLTYGKSRIKSLRERNKFLNGVLIFLLFSIMLSPALFATSEGNERIIDKGILIGLLLFILRFILLTFQQGIS